MIFKDRFGYVDNGEETPDNIPNSAVKLSSGDDSARVTWCQNSKMYLLYKNPSGNTGVFFCLKFKHLWTMIIEEFRISDESKIILLLLKLLMVGKILKFQLLLFFCLTIGSILSFFFQDSIPDNYFFISSLNDSFNPLSFYASSTLVLLGYAFGPWIFSPFLIFTILYSFLIARREKWIDTLGCLPLFIGTLILSYWFVPEFLGEGLLQFIELYLNIFYQAILLAGSLFSFFFVYFRKLSLFPFGGINKFKQLNIRGLFRSLKFKDLLKPLRIILKHSSSSVTFLL